VLSDNNLKVIKSSSDAAARVCFVTRYASFFKAHYDDTGSDQQKVLRFSGKAERVVKLRSPGAQGGLPELMVDSGG
jgi:hypothetical protein